MFYKIGSTVSAERTTIADWRKLIVEASVRQDPEKIEALGEFELDKDNFLYVRTRAVSAFELHGPNQNSDAFEAAELEKSYRTFVRRGVYVNHDSDNPEKAIGIHLDAFWHPQPGFVQTLLAIDKSESIAHKIEAGIANSWSMGALVERCICSVCDKTATSEKEYCEHLANHLGKEYNGRKVYALNRGVNFYEQSNVTIPADPNAYTLEVLANKKDKFQAYKTLADRYTVQAGWMDWLGGEPSRPADWDSAVKYLQSIDGSVAQKGPGLFTVRTSGGSWDMPEQQVIQFAQGMFDKMNELQADASKRVDTQALAADVRGKLDEAPKPQSERQILGKVRHKLKVAKAPLLPRGAMLHRRVQAALDAAQTPVETPNQMIEEDTPLEGLKVENQLTIRYVPGDRLEDCYFIARKGNLQAMVSASKILDPEVQRNIEASEKGKVEKTADMTSGTPNEGLLKDETKPSPDNTGQTNVGKDPVGQPKDKANDLSAKPAKELKDETKPSADSTHTLGKDPIQPSDVVKKYAQLLGAKTVTFKRGEAGVFTAALSNGSISKLSTLWGIVPKLVKEAKIAGQPMTWSREEAPLVETDMRSQPTVSREAVKNLEKPAGSTGSETKSYYQQLDSKDLATGGQDAWARKASELSKQAELLNKQNSALKSENDTLKKALEAQKRASIEEKKRQVIGGLLEVIEKSGGIRADESEVIDLQEKGLSFEDSQVKAYSLAKDRKIAELKSMDVPALELMLKNFAEFLPNVQVKQAKAKDMPLPSMGRDEGFDRSEDTLSQLWDK